MSGTINPSEFGFQLAKYSGAGTTLSPTDSLAYNEHETEAVLFIGNDTVKGGLSISNNSTVPCLGVINYRNDHQSSKIGFFRLRGTDLENSEPVQIGDELGRFSWSGYGGGCIDHDHNTSWISARVSNTPTHLFVPANIELVVTASNGKTSPQLTVNSSGGITVAENITITANSIGTNDSSTIEFKNPIRLAHLTQEQRDAYSAVDGDMIFNSTIKKVEIFENGTWVRLTQ